MSTSLLLNYGHFGAMNSDSYIMKGLNPTHTIFMFQIH